ncbi:MAG TPA: ribbon-helix-helix domain-containing protein [Pyrinomonadaceae bacterium]|jgi:predicted transcriptional regulator|nr:ribbon-helix-helix domain-containing protein [Pyrinomonadaceae bacterium]
MTVNQAAKNKTRGSPKNEKEKVRLSLDISPELNELLEQLAGWTGSTKSEVLRKAIALMEVAVEAKRQGKKFGIAEKDQQLSTEIIGL